MRLFQHWRFFQNSTVAYFPSSWLRSVKTSRRASIFSVLPMSYIITFLKPKIQQFQVPMPLRIHSVIFIFVYVTLYFFEAYYVTSRSAMLDHNPVLSAPAVTHKNIISRKWLISYFQLEPPDAV